MAVVVQQMIPAEAAGVLFTVDPVSGSHGRMVIEAAAGLGSQVVSGRVNPECVVVAKATLRILRRRATIATPYLDGALVRRLGKLARKAERLFQRPVDIEWAVVGGRVFLLQARPVSIAPKPKAWEDRQVWTNLNTGEVFPDVPTTISWSMIQTLIAPLFRSIFRLFGADVAKGPTAGLVAGRIYFNVNTAVAALRPFSFALGRVPGIAQALGGGQIEMYEAALTDIPDEDLPDLGFRWLDYVLSWPRILRDLAAHSPGRSTAFLARMQTHAEQLSRMDFVSMSTAELARAFPKVVQESLGDWDLLHLFMRAGVLLMFHRICRGWLADPDLRLAYRLFAGLGGIPQAEAGLALWRLAALAHADEPTEAALLAGTSWSDTVSRLEKIETGRRFVAAWDTFMTWHGHHCRGELELSNPRWAESPGYILGLVRGYLRATGQSDPLDNQRRLAEAREQLTEQCRRRLRNPLKRAVFSWTLRRVQQLAVDREQWKDCVVRHVAVLRRMLLVLGERLAREGALLRRDDIFFLELAEIEPVGTGKARFDFQQLIASRRAEYEKNQSLAPPPTVSGRYDPCAQVAPTPDATATMLTGLPVFPGTATGRARVILRTDDHEQVLPGEILIAPFTDPAWTPYFILAAGVVMDQGGVLSHGSIVAREYGLPAVTNVVSATRIIRTGDLVQVDGGRGSVTIVERIQHKKRS